MKIIKRNKQSYISVRGYDEGIPIRSGTARMLNDVVGDAGLYLKIKVKHKKSKYNGQKLLICGKDILSFYQWYE